MKKAFSLLLAVLMVIGLFASCAKNEPAPSNTPANTPADTPANTDAETPAEETPAEEEPAAEEPAAEEPAAEIPAEEPAAEVTAKEEGTLIDQMDTWHWRTFECQYIDGNGEFSGSARGGHYENDEMADFLAANPEWYKDTAMMAGWEELEGPFGDRLVSALAGSTPFTADPDNNHGLMVYKTFQVDDLNDDTLYDLIMFYDNTIYCYINGEPYFIEDTNCGADGNDWTDDYVLLKSNQSDKSFKDFLHIGENYICASIKDCWGGREFDAYITYEKGSTKKDLTFFDQGSEWHYTVFTAPYIDGNGEAEGSAAGGHFEPDGLADYIAANPNFMTDTATAAAWPTGKSPMSSGAEGWTGENHGLMLYTTFTVDSVADVKNCDEFNLYGDYDNAIHVWLNGVEIYTDDGEAVNQDWQYGINASLDKDLVLSTLKDGENYMIVTVKDAWGGREWNCGFRAHWN
jgi:Periplasmic protein TonB, links inner and outer membranes